MAQNTLPMETQNLFERLVEESTLRRAFAAVKRNRGSAGIDGVTVEQYAANLTEELAQLNEELINWRYKPKPVRQVEIPKPTGGVRVLGIPSVRDRVVQTGIKLLLEPILEPTFSIHSYGFRPGRNQRQALESAQAIAQTGKCYVVDIDLSKFFDRINHDRLIHHVGRHIPDRRILRLIGMMLRSGIMRDGLCSPTSLGVTQGSPLSPLLSNVVLDELDKELEKRGLKFCRYADDCNIFVGSRKAAERIMGSVSFYIENKLKLKVNTEKSRVGLTHEVKFLGMTIVEGTLAIAKESLSRAGKTLKYLIPRGSHHTLEMTMKRVNSWYMGWSGYYSMTQYPSQLRKIEAHIRRRLRSRIVGHQKSRRTLCNKLERRGVNPKTAFKAVYLSQKKRWWLSHCRAMELAYPNRWFIKELGQKLRSHENRSHWFGVDKWVHLS